MSSRCARAIAKEKGDADPWDLKYAAGALVDIEFIAQYLQLVHAAAMPDILDTSTARVLEKAARLGVLAAEDAAVLRPAVRLFHDLTQIFRLCLPGAFDPKRRAPACSACSPAPPTCRISRHCRPTSWKRSVRCGNASCGFSARRPGAPVQTIRVVPAPRRTNTGSGGKTPKRISAWLRRFDRTVGLAPRAEAARDMRYRTKAHAMRSLRRERRTPAAGAKEHETLVLSEDSACDTGSSGRSRIRACRADNETRRDAAFALKFADVAQIDEGHVIAPVQSERVLDRQRLDLALGGIDERAKARLDLLRHGPLRPELPRSVAIYLCRMAGTTGGKATQVRAGCGKGGGGTCALQPRPAAALRRQPDHDHRAGAEGRADAHRAAVQFGQRFGDGEAQARALMALGQLAFDLLERPAELAQRVLRDADAGVLDGDGDAVAGARVRAP